MSAAQPAAACMNRMRKRKHTLTHISKPKEWKRDGEAQAPFSYYDEGPRGRERVIAGLSQHKEKHTHNTVSLQFVVYVFSSISCAAPWSNENDWRNNQLYQQYQTNKHECVKEQRRKKESPKRNVLLKFETLSRIDFNCLWFHMHFSYNFFALEINQRNTLRTSYEQFE